MTSWLFFMDAAFAEAEKAWDLNEVPVGAVVVHDGQIVGRGHNLTRQSWDPTAHAEIVALRQAGQTLQTAILDTCDLYVTLEPCAMCAGALAHARIHRIFFGAYDPKGGAIDHGPRLFQQPTLHHHPQCLGGIQETRSGDLLRAFFAAKRG